MEEATCRYRADRHVTPVMSTMSVSLLAVGIGRCKLLRSGSEEAMAPAEGGCVVISGGVSAVGVAVAGAGAGFFGAGTRIPGTKGRVPEAGASVV
jgi:hypothetical protein